MKKQVASIALGTLTLLALAGCGQKSAESASQAVEPAKSTAASGSAAQLEATAFGDYLSSISGSYIELFPELSKEEYRSIWHDAAAPLVGEDNADAATDMLLGMCMAEPYGAEAIEKYAADPDSTAFNCYFLGGVKEFVMDCDTTTGLDEAGNEVFSHTYDAVHSSH